jgi:hypothetical protein
MNTTVPVPETLAEPAVSVLELICPGQVSQARQLRATLHAFLGHCPLAADVIALGWELVSNACLHSASGLPGGCFTLTVRDFPASYVYAAVADEGGDWAGDLETASRAPHGLYLLREIATSCGTAGGRCGRTVWFTIAYPCAPVRSRTAPAPLAGRSAA